MKKLTGLVPPVMTFFDRDGTVNYTSMKKHADFLIQGGVDGLAYLGTTGEFSVMTQAQKLKLIRTMVPYIKGRATAVVGIGDTCLTNTLELATAAEQAGADALLAVFPYFSVYAEANVEAYYEALANAVHLPVILYNFPALTGFDLNPQLVRRLLKKCPNIRAIKDTVPEVDHLRQMMALREEFPDFSVFCAYETQALQMAQERIDGFVNATANFAPQFTAQLLAARRAADPAAMQSAWEKMCKAAKVYEHSIPLFLSVKEAVYQTLPECRGFERLPGLALTPEMQHAVHNDLQQLKNL